MSKQKRWDELATEKYPQLLRYSEDAAELVRSEAAIHPLVWKSRGYLPYAPEGHLQPRTAAQMYYRHPETWTNSLSLTMNEDTERAIIRRMSQRSGLAMTRHALRGAPWLPPQLRPFKMRELMGFDVAAEYGAQDEGVYSRTVKHDHAKQQTHQHGFAPRKHTPQAIDLPSGTWKVRSTPKWLPLDGDVNKMAQHLERFHPLVAPSPTQRHQHPWNPAAHVAAEHGGKSVAGQHEHDEYAKYLYPWRVEARRIDVHPLAWPLLESGGPVVYFVMEGILKNDSVLSFRWDDGGTPVVGCGSVTLWNETGETAGAHYPGLDELAREYLSRFNTVVCVPDSDWHGNSMVVGQATHLRDHLASLVPNTRVVVAAPPAKCATVCEHNHGDDGGRYIGEDVTGQPMYLPNAEHKQGVDDFLYARGDLMDMVVPGVGIVDDAETYGLVRRHVKGPDTTERDTRVFTWIRRHCDETGRMDRPLRAIQLGAGIASLRAVSEALANLYAAGLLAREDVPKRLSPRYGAYVPTVLRVAPEFVPDRTPLRRLRDYLANT